MIKTNFLTKSKKKSQESIHTFLYKQHFYKQCQAKISKKSRKN